MKNSLPRCLLLLLASVCLLPSVASALSFRTVVIDAGHGGKDPGCMRNGLVEKRLCLDVAKRLESSLKRRGVRVVMTRRTDSFVELSSRARLANRQSRAIFVSLHFNSNRRTNRSGMEVFYRSSRGKTLARGILRSMDNRLIGVNKGVTFGNYKVLRETSMPAVLIEPCYLSHKKDSRRAASPQYRQNLAEAIASGIMATRG